jgi:hypothetical protein
VVVLKTLQKILFFEHYMGPGQTLKSKYYGKLPPPYIIFFNQFFEAFLGSSQKNIAPGKTNSV